MAHIPCQELVRVRKELEGLQQARLVDFTPVLETHRQHLCRREAELLGWGRMSQSLRFSTSPS